MITGDYRYNHMLYIIIIIGKYKHKLFLSSGLPYSRAKNSFITLYRNAMFISISYAACMKKYTLKWRTAIHVIVKDNQ